MVIISARWLGICLDIVASLLIGAVTLVAAFMAQDAGNFTSLVDN